MSGVRISALPAANAVEGTDLLPVVQGTGPVKTARRVAVAAVVEMAVEAASGFAVPVEITTTPGQARTLTAADHGYTLIWDDDAALPVIVPDDLPEGFQVTLTQLGDGQALVDPASGVTVTNRLGHNGTAGPGASIVLMQGLDATTYTLGGDTGFATETEAPVIQANVSVVVDTSDPAGTPAPAFTVQRAAGQVSWTMTGTDWVIDLTTGVPSTADTLPAGTYEETVTASNLHGDDTALFTAEVIEAGYDPIGAGAVAWFQPRRAATRGIIDPIGDGSQAYAYILDAEERGPQLYAASDPYAYPRPTLVDAGQFNGLDTASFTDVTSRLVGNALLIDVMENVTGLGIEMVISPGSLAALSSVLTQRITGILTLFGIDITTDGQITVTTRRQQTDSARTETTAVGLRTGGRHYLYVGINYGTGLITVQIDDVVETFAGTWTGGTGSTPASMTGAFTLGALGGIAAWRIAELAIYPNVVTLETRTANRALLLPVYDLAGTSVPGVPTAEPIVSPVDLAIDDSYLAGRQVWRMQVDNIAEAGAVTWTIESGNGDGYFAIDDETGWISAALDMDSGSDPAFTLVVRGTNSLGYDEADVTIAVGAAVYNPGAWDALFWSQAHNDAVRTVVDQSGTPSISSLLDMQGSDADLYAGGGSFLNPTLVTTWNSLDVMRFSGSNVILAGDARVRDVLAGSSLVACEMAVAFIALGATRDVVRWSNSSVSTTRFKVDLLSSGALRVTCARLDTDTSRTFTTTATVTAGAKNYLFASVDFTDGEIVVQINGTTETTTVSFDGGFGVSDADRPASFRMGYYTAAPSMDVAELAFYRDTAPNAAERVINREALTATYGLV
jgi:hypothetical protein